MMPTLVRPRTVRPAAVPARASVDSASLVADYLTFEKQRQSRRQYMKAFGGMAALVLLGAAFNRVPVGEAWIVAELLAALPLWLAAVEALTWRRLVRRLNHLRIQTQDEEKVIKKS